MIKKVLVANRGEIAVRVMRSCREMGIKTVAVFSDADRTSFHVRYADEAYHIGPSPSNESYLNIDRIIDTAKQSGSDAIHPGYGFLSENADFASRCESEGLIFIGPSEVSISAMGDKITARGKMMNAGVPVVPGTDNGIQDDKAALGMIKKIGLPVMIKASAGGGGKGMRLVWNEGDILSSLRAARSEALSAFGNDAVYIEKYIESPHHVEFQVLADQHGNVIHLCERECSVQRRHQKVIEETPSPFMTSGLRRRMGQDAVAAARAADYVGAGTIEFLVDKDRNYYFLEMNTRLQVEHPITEWVVGVDLVKEQIRIANGEKLGTSQSDIQQNGHSIECRIYAEDPGNNFMPSPGVIKHITQPTGLGVRIDGYVYEGYEIPIYYDPLIAKLITWGINRDEAIARMKRALYEYRITGVQTSISFLERIMNTPDFIRGKYDTHFIENNKELLMSKSIPHYTEYEDIALIAAIFDYIRKLQKIQPLELIHNGNGNSAWKAYGRKKAVIRI